jgi:hypothetical protein
MGVVGSIFTFGDMVRRILNGMNEPATPKNVNATADYLNDGIESIWMSMLLATLSRFSKGPVSQIIPAGSQSTQVISVPDPVAGPAVVPVFGGALPARTYYITYCLVTGSGSTTLLSPPTHTDVLQDFLIQVFSPSIAANISDDVVGYYVFAGIGLDLSDQGQQSPLIKIGDTWTEPAAGITPAPNTPYPPKVNTTGDNIFNIVRLDVQNVDTTWTQWLQTNLNSTWFTDFQHSLSTTSTYIPYVYDFIADRQLEVRPAPGADITGVYFYTSRPRRLRFDVSRLPYPQFAITGFLNAYVRGKLSLDLYEYDANDRWDRTAEQERQRIIYQVSATNNNQGNTIKPFRR